MRGWAKKWGELIEKGPEYGTTEAAWKGMLTESDRLSDVHTKIKENLCNDVISQIKAWQKDNYHKVRKRKLNLTCLCTKSHVFNLEYDAHQGTQRNGRCI